MPGLRADTVALYMRDMYVASRETYKQAPTVYDRTYKVVKNVVGAGDKITQILGAGALQRHLSESQKIDYKSPVQGWEFLTKYWTYSDGIALSKEAVEDTVKLGNLLRELASTWGISYRVEKEELAARPFNHGGDLTGDWVFNGTHTGNTDSSGDLLYDGYPLFNLTGNARSTKGGGTYYNSVAGLSVSAANFETLYNLHTATNNRDERDRVVQNPCDTFLCRPGSDYFLGERIFKTPRDMGLPGSQLNDINPYYGKITEVIPWDYLDSSEAAFFVGKRQSPDFQFRERQLPEIRMFRDESDLGYKASYNVRMGVLIKNFRTWTRGGGTSS